MYSTLVAQFGEQDYNSVIEYLSSTYDDAIEVGGDNLCELSRQFLDLQISRAQINRLKAMQKATSIVQADAEDLFNYSIYTIRMQELSAQELKLKMLTLQIKRIKAWLKRTKSIRTIDIYALTDKITLSGDRIKWAIIASRTAVRRKLNGIHDEMRENCQSILTLVENANEQLAQEHVRLIVKRREILQQLPCSEAQLENFLFRNIKRFIDKYHRIKKALAA